MFLRRFAVLVTMASCPLTLQAQTYLEQPGTLSSTTHAGGTVVVAVGLSDGLVLAADSRLTITFPKGVTPEYKVASDYAPKLFNIGQVAIASFGEAFVSARSIGSYVSALEASLKGSPPANVDDLAKQFVTFFGKYYEKETAQAHTSPDIGFIFAGYDKSGIGKVLEVDFPKPGAPKILNNTHDGQGATWHGQTDVISRLLKGVDPAVGNLPAWLTLPDEKQQALAKEIAGIEYQIPIQYMMLQDGVDFALTLVQATVDMQRFSFGTMTSPGSIPGVGGTVDVVVVTPTELIWVRKKSLTAK
jgi:hypothetical protein